MLDLKSLLNEEQIEPVLTMEGPVMVFAGAGSGKTRVLTYRIANLLMHGVDPYSILAITFTNKAANEMSERVYNVTQVSGITISTFHSFCVKILRQYIFKLGDFTNNFTIYDEEDSEKILKKIVKEKFEEIEDEELKKLFKEVKWHISHAKTTGHSPETYERVILGNIMRNEIIQSFIEYNHELQKNNALDFDDILLFTVKLLSTCPDVLEACQERYKYIHVDEFQDTNSIQFAILKFLGIKYHNVFVVGDDDQSIYGWRGADYKNIKNFLNAFPGCKIFKLEQNYRSTKNILNAANSVIAHNRDRSKKVLWTENNEGARVEVKKAYDEKEEADYVLSMISNLMRNYDYSYKDFAVLVRTTSITMPIEEKLRLYNIPYRMIGGKKFFDRKEVKDFLAYLKIVANPRDEISILRVINVPKRGIGETAIKRLKDACDEKNITLFEGLINLVDLNLSSVIYKKLLPFAALIKDFNSKKDMPLVDFVEYVEAEVDFTRIYDIDKEEDAARLENIKELIRSIKEFHISNPMSGLAEYLQSVTLLTSDDANDAESNVLTVATVHGVKGLEFKCVFIIGLEKGIFPIERKEMLPQEMEEERRIMYVAMTRAKERLYLTHTMNRYRFGNKIFCSESPYIKEANLNKNRPENVFNVINGYEPKARGIIDYTATQKRETPAFAQKNTIAPANDKDLSIFRIGQKVEHARFGEGRILTISGEQADISFETLGVKKFNLRLAPITVVE